MVQAVRRISSPAAAGLFLGIAALVLAVEAAVSARISTSAMPRVLAAAVALDLAVFLPALYWFGFARHKGWPWVTTLPVFVLGLVAATGLLPAEQRSVLRPLELLAIPAELGLVGYVVWKVRAGFKARKAAADAGTDDLLDALRIGFRKALEVRLPAEALASEVALFGYALGFGKRPTRDDAREFTVHKEVGYGAVLFALGMAMVAELAAVHVLLMRWSPLAAWIHVGLSLYGMLWLVGDFRALSARPVRWTGDGLELRVGLRWSLEIPQDEIRSLTRRRPADPLPEGPDHLTARVLGDPNFLLELHHPVEARGLYGLRKRVRTVAFRVDRAGDFAARAAGAVREQRGDLP